MYKICHAILNFVCVILCFTDISNYKMVETVNGWGKESGLFWGLRSLLILLYRAHNKFHFTIVSAKNWI